MNGPQLTHRPASEVADHLSEANKVFSNEELTSALINALNRIHNLEHQVETLNMTKNWNL
jgi:hypothetical protein